MPSGGTGTAQIPDGRCGRVERAMWAGCPLERGVGALLRGGRVRRLRRHAPPAARIPPLPTNVPVPPRVDAEFADIFFFGAPGRSNPRSNGLLRRKPAIV